MGHANVRYVALFIERRFSGTNGVITPNMEVNVVVALSFFTFKRTLEPLIPMATLCGPGGQGRGRGFNDRIIIVALLEIRC